MSPQSTAIGPGGLDAETRAALKRLVRRNADCAAGSEFSGYGTPCALADLLFCLTIWRRRSGMNGLIYLIGLIVVIMAILSFFGLR